VHPAHDASIAAVTGDPLRRVYERIDQALGRIVAAAGEAQVVVFSAHGMSHWYGAQFLLPRILEQLGVAAPPPKSPVTLRRATHALVLAAWKTLPEFVRRPVRATRNAIVPRTAVESASEPVVSADVTRSKCFMHPNGLAVGGIRLNIAGREPNGLLQSGAQTEEFIAWLSSALLEIIDERTGKPLITRVLRTSDLYAGEFLDVLPDLLVEWNDRTPTGSLGVANGVAARVRVSSPGIGRLEGDNEFARTGEHRAGGWLVAAGPGIAPGRLDSEPSLMDLAPTLTEMLGVTMPGCDGQLIPRLVRRPPLDS
jgi:predicted AlkP superfamily phosphohydrolase/phosphomutase